MALRDLRTRALVVDCADICFEVAKAVDLAPSAVSMVCQGGPVDFRAEAKIKGELASRGYAVVPSLGVA